MPERTFDLERRTAETRVQVHLNLDGTGQHEIATGIGFFDHMLTLFTAHGFLDLTLRATGDLEVDMHHTVEDVGLALGDALSGALGEKKQIRRYGHAVTPMDETLTAVTIDLSNRPFLVCRFPSSATGRGAFDCGLTKEFLRAFATRGKMNLHVNVHYGENEHHIIESIFKSTGRALKQAVSLDDRVRNVRSTKGAL